MGKMGQDSGPNMVGGGKQAAEGVGKGSQLKAGTSFLRKEIPGNGQPVPGNGNRGRMGMKQMSPLGGMRKGK